MVLFATGRKAESDAQPAKAIRQNETDWPEGIASVYAVRGEKGRAFEWLDRAYQARDHLYLIKGNLLFKNLWGDPHYKALLRKMNLPEWPQSFRNESLHLACSIADGDDRPVWVNKRPSRTPLGSAC
jgi:hypothetical protein